MKRNLVSSAGFAALGLIVGYAVFGKWGGQYVGLKTLFSFGGSAIQDAFRSISGLDDMRNKMVLCGIAGAVVGALISLKLKK